MSAQWGPWVEHDGKWCPSYLLGRFVEVERVREEDKSLWTESFVVTPLLASCASWEGLKYFGSGRVGEWDGRFFPMEYVVRYRIGKPRGLVVLETILADLPAPQSCEVTA